VCEIQQFPNCLRLLARIGFEPWIFSSPDRSSGLGISLLA